MKNLRKLSSLLLSFCFLCTSLPTIATAGPVEKWTVRVIMHLENVDGVVKEFPAIEMRVFGGDDRYDRLVKLNDGEWKAVSITGADKRRVSKLVLTPAGATNLSARLTIGDLRNIPKNLKNLLIRSVWQYLKSSLLELSILGAYLTGSIVIPEWILPTATAALRSDDYHRSYIYRIFAARIGKNPALTATTCGACYDELRKIVGSDNGDLTSKSRFELYTRAVAVPGFVEEDLRTFLDGGVATLLEGGKFVQRPVRGLTDWASDVLMVCSTKTGGSNSSQAGKVRFEVNGRSQEAFLPSRDAVCSNPLPSLPPSEADKGILRVLWENFLAGR